MSKILAFGDSFVAGDLDDFVTRDRDHWKNNIPTHGMTDEARWDYVKYNVSFAAKLARHFDCDLVNCADSGSSNYRQLDRLMYQLHIGAVKSDDVILFGLTTTARDRVALTHEWKPGIHHNLMHNWKSGLHNMVDVFVNGHNNWDLIELHDLFFILATLDSVSRQYNVPVIKFNIFDNLLNTGFNTKISYPHDNFLGWEFKNNTLMDILDDTWGTNIDKPRILHNNVKPKPGLENLYTWNKHPSIEGQEKIYNWFLKNVNWPSFFK